MAGARLPADVVTDTLGHDQASGAILLISSQSLMITSRTYNDAATGTFGQFIPGVHRGQWLAGTDSAEGAKYLLANLKRYADRQKRRAEKQQTEAPAKCLATWQELKRRYVGTEIAAEAGKKLKELTADKAFQTERKAERAYHPISIAFGKVPPCPSKARAKTLWQARWSGAARQIKARVDALKKQYPDSHFAAKAETKYKEMVGAK